ncbi:MAG TPA: hypothetical protein VJS43_08820 [Candidatus Acidoferrales bacterium]|nr:hypothetical protein [Candidatus Acidoferrales bacterium]
MSGAGPVKMWGSLHVDASRQPVGWLVDSWTEITPETGPHLRPEMHWYEGGKFYCVRVSIEFRTNVQILGEDAGIDPVRAAAVKTTIAAWEKDWLEDSAK